MSKHEEEKAADKAIETRKETDEQSKVSDEARKSAADLVKRQRQELQEQKDPNRPAKATSIKFGRPEIIGEGGRTLVKGTAATGKQAEAKTIKTGEKGADGLPEGPTKRADAFSKPAEAPRKAADAQPKPAATAAKTVDATAKPQDAKTAEKPAVPTDAKAGQEVDSKMKAVDQQKIIEKAIKIGSSTTVGFYSGSEPIVDALRGTTEAERGAIKESYRKTYGKDLEVQLKETLSGTDLQRALNLLNLKDANAVKVPAGMNRDELVEANKRLHQSTEPIDPFAFTIQLNALIPTKTPAEIKVMSALYKEEYGVDFDHHLKDAGMSLDESIKQVDRLKSENKLDKEVDKAEKAQSKGESLEDKGHDKLAGQVPSATVDRADAKPEAQDKAALQMGAGDSKDLATHVQDRAQLELVTLHRNLKTTLSGARPKEFDSSETTLTADKTAAQIADAMLGPDSTTAQKELYAKIVLSMNKLPVDAGGGYVIPTGTKLKLPGQTSDGGITWQTDKETNTIWSDKSAIARKNDGTGLAHYEYEGKSVEVKWDSKHLDGNHWHTSAEVKNPDGTVSQKQSETTYDAQSRSIERNYTDDPLKPTSIAVVGRDGARIDFTPDAGGEFKGSKTRNGEVVDANMGMTPDGRIFSQTSDAKGNVIRTFENRSVETYDKVGNLVAVQYEDAQRRVVEVRYSKPGTADSMTISDSRSVIELKRNERGDLLGVKKDTSGNTIEMHMAMGTDGRIYARSWNAQGIETRRYETGEREKFDQYGTTLERTKTASGLGSTTEFFKNGKVDRVAVSRPDNTTIEFTVASDGSMSGVKKDAAGHPIDKNMRMSGNEIFSEIKEGTNTVRTYDDGSVKKFDEHNQLIFKQGKDVGGRQLTEYYRPGEAKPFKETLQVSKDQPPLEFNRTKDGQYVNEKRTSDGETFQTTELRKDGSLHISLPVLKAETTIDAAGNVKSTQDVVTPYGSIRTVVERTGTEASTTQSLVGSDGKLTKLNEVYTDAAQGTTVERHFKDGKHEGTTIKRPAGTIALKVTPDGLIGENRDKDGNVIESVMFKGDKLMFRNLKDGSIRAESYSWGDHITPQLEHISYDADAGTISTSGLFDMKHSYSPGRFDLGAPFGISVGITVNGDLSYERPDGTAGVSHSDATGARFTDDGKIEYWDKEKSTTDELTAHEAAMAKNPDVDKRFMLEIHRRFAGDRAKIDGFYQGLEKIQAAKNLSDKEKQGLVNNLMHHVAYPAEIYQGSAPTCNVTVVQRDMAMRDPDKYAAFVACAAVDGKFTTASGNVVEFDRENLKAGDYSGRDIGSRVFQTAALNVVRHPKQTYANAGDGTGRWTIVNSIDLPDWDLHLKDSRDGGAMNGLRGVEIARVMSEITGEARAEIEVKSVEDLVALYNHNGGPVTIRVDGNIYPFDKNGPMDAGVAGHVVTITGVDKGPPVRVRVQNQWGLGADKSGTSTAIEAADVFNNMLHRGDGHAYTVARSPEPNKKYELAVNRDGSLKFKETGVPKYDEHMNPLD